jgi:mannose-6-phosphate isomerase
MANSDNVFRAGLTPKHMDIDALLEHLVFEPVTPKVIHPSKVEDHIVTYKSPAQEFELQIIELKGGEITELTTGAGECYLLLEGNVEVSSGNTALSVSKGQSFFSSKDININFSSTGRSRLVRATLP